MSKSIRVIPGWIEVALLALLVVSGGGPAAGQASPKPDVTDQMLSLSRKAVGGDAWDDVRTLHTVSRIQAAGLAGRAESWTDVATGRFVDRYSLPPTSGGHGFNGTLGWIQDGSGEVRIEDSIDERRESADESYRRSLAMWFSKRHAAEILDGGTIQELDHRFRVARITPAGGRPYEMWLDALTFLPVRIVETGNRQTQSTYLLDYRPIHGIWVPYATRVTNGDRLFDQKTFVETVEVNVEIPDGAFSPPRPLSVPGK